MGSFCRASPYNRQKQPMGKAHPLSLLGGTRRVSQRLHCGQGSGHPTASKALKQTFTAREVPDAERGSQAAARKGDALQFWGNFTPYWSRFPFLGRNESVAQHCRALPERPWVPSRKDATPRVTVPGSAWLPGSGRDGGEQPGSASHTPPPPPPPRAASLRSAVRRRSSTASLPGSRLPLCTSQHRHTRAGAIPNSRTQGNETVWEVWQKKTNNPTFLPQVSPAPFLLGSGVTV